MGNKLSQTIKRFFSPRSEIINSSGQSPNLVEYSAQYGAWLNARSRSGEPVNQDLALRLTAVWACVRLISETIATLPLGLYKKQADSGRKALTDNQVYWLLRTSPNAKMTSVQFWEAVVASMLLWGNAYIEKVRSGDTVVALEFLLPWRVDLDCDDAGNLIYYYTPPKGTRRRIPNDNMLHIPAFSLDGQIGLSPIRYGADTLGSAIAAEDVAGNTFNNGLHQTVAFTVDRTMKPEQREEFREYIKAIS